MLGRNRLYLLGWLVAATVLLSLVGLTAKPLHPQTEAKPAVVIMTNLQG